MRETQAVREGWTNYSDKIPGEKINHGWAIAVDAHASGCIGITQYDDLGAVADRVLLSPSQWKAAIRFVRNKTPR